MLTVTMCAYEPDKHELFSYALGEDGRIGMKMLDPAAKIFGDSVLKAPMYIDGKWARADDSPMSWLSALPTAYAGSRVQAHITER